MGFFLREKLDWDYRRPVRFQIWMRNSKPHTNRLHLNQNHLGNVGEPWLIDVEKYDSGDMYAFLEDLNEEMVRQQLPDNEYYLRGFKGQVRGGYKRGIGRKHYCIRRDFRYVAHFYKEENYVDDLHVAYSKAAPKGRHKKNRWGRAVLTTKPGRMFALNLYFSGKLDSPNEYI